MIVELIGCAGAGKTTLLRAVCEHGIAGRRVVAMPDLLVDRPLLRHITHPTAVNIVQEVGSLPFLLRALREEREFIAFARGLLRQHARTTYDRANGMRGIARKVGMLQLARSRARDTIVLSDEGTLLSAYNLFVMTDVVFRSADIERFARLVPLPDAVVYVRAPVESLVGRASSRPDPRRQHIGHDATSIEHDVLRTVRLFDLLSASAPLEGRVSIVDNTDADPAARDRLAETIAQEIASAAAALRPAGAHPGPPAPSLADTGSC